MRLTKTQMSVAMLWMLISIVMTILVGASATDAQQADDGGLGIDTTARARAGDRNGNAILTDRGQGLTTVTITLEGQNCPTVPRERPVDVVLVIDVSTSMNEDAGNTTRIEAVRNSAVPFLARFNFLPDIRDSLTGDLIPNPQSDQVAVVVFSDSTEIILDFNRDSNTITTAIQTLSLRGGTNMAPGFQQARYLLEGRNASPNSSSAPNTTGDALPVIVMLTDGESADADETREQVRLARISLPELQIVTIAFGEDADSQLMEDISNSNNFFQPTTDQALLQAFDNIATLVQPRLAATGIRVEYTLAGGFTFGNTNEVSPPPTTITTNSLIWDGLGDVYTGDVVEFSFDVSALSVGTSPAGTLTVTYVSCGEPTTRTVQLTQPDITVVLPTPTPTPTFTPTATITPTPTPTLTPLPPAWTSPQTGATAPSSTDVGVTGLLCDPSFFDLLPYIVAFIALLIALYFIWRGFKNLQQTAQGCRDVACWIIRSLFLLWLVWVIFLFLQPVASAICPIPESVYFWRMDGNQSGIYITNDNTEAPAQVVSLNEQGCVGCHTVNSPSGQLAAVRGGVPGRLVSITLDGEPIDIPGVSAVYSAFSPDGTQLAYTDSESNLFVMTIASRQIVPLPNASSATHGALMPAWTSDGRTIAYVRYERSNSVWDLGLEFENASDIYQINATGEGSPTPLVTQADLGGLNYYPAFSPDGRWLAFTHAPSGNSYSNPDGDIWLLDIRTPRADNFSSVARPIEGNSSASDTWATWNRDGSRLAFNSTRNDSNYDIVIAELSPDGTTSAAAPLRGASSAGVFEHLPFWGDPPARTDVMEAWADLLPWLIPLIILGLLSLLCLLSRRKPVEVTPISTPTAPPPPQPIPPKDLERWDGIKALWRPKPALIIGVGVSGWHVLTQIKKGLMDAGLGVPSDKVRLLCIMAKEQDTLIEAEKFTGARLSDDEIVRWQDSVQPLIDGARTDPTLRDWLNISYLNNQGEAATNPRMGLGGSANRQLGRLAFINNLRGNSRYTRQDMVLSLQEALERVLNEGMLTALIVSDLSDDVGAGAMLDVAVAIRTLNRSQNRSNTTHLIGHFMTSRATGGFSQNDNLRPANTTASIRELSRFQLAANAPFDLNYGDGNVLNTRWESVLFDEINLHDSSRTLTNLDPQLAVYPSVADSILLWLDESSLKGGLYEWRNERKSNATDKQISQRKMIVSGMGVYQYRLPFADLLEEATVRYVRQLLLNLVAGRTGIMLKLDPNLSEDMFFSALGKPTKDPATLVSAFMTGWFGFGKVNQDWVRVFMILNGMHPQDGKNPQADLSRAFNNLQPNMPTDGVIFAEWLNLALLTLLNGENSLQADHMRKKGAKLALAMSFLITLRNKLGEFKQIAGERHQQITMAFDDFIIRVNDAYVNLEKVADALGVTGTNSQSLYRLLDERRDIINARISASQKLQTRTYITEMEKEGKTQRVRIADEWYETYLKDNIAEGMSQFKWELTRPDGDVVLLVKLPQRSNEREPKFIALNLTDASEFEAALLQLGQYFARKVREEFSISDVLGKGVLNRNNIEDTANTLFNNSQPLLLVNSANAPNQQAGIVFSSNRNLVNKAELRELLAGKLLDPKGLIPLDTEDPFTITLAQTIDVVPTDAIPALQKDEGVYVSETFSHNKDRPTAVFDAEQNALFYERQLRDKLEQAHRVFHPLVVTALAKRRQTEAYLIAVAIAKEWSSTDSDGVVFTSQETGRLNLFKADKPTFFPLLDGLYAFMHQVDDITAERLYNRYQNDVNLLEDLYAWSQTKGESWRRSILRGDDNNTDNERILNDLIAITLILADAIV